MDLHEFCLSTLNHEITRALACSKRLDQSLSTNMLADFGLLHFFVVSGTHLNFILDSLKSIKNSQPILLAKLCLLFLFVAMCNFSPPVLRVFGCYLIKISLFKKNFFIPALLSHFVSYLLCLILFNRSPSLSFSTNLSFAFSLFLFWSKGGSATKTICSLYILTVPFFAYSFGVPHISNLVLSPLTGFVLVGALLPLSIASIGLNHTEFFAIKIWWFYKSFVEAVAVFFNYPKKFNFENTFIGYEKLILFNFVFFIATSAGVIFWRRKSYSFL